MVDEVEIQFSPIDIFSNDLFLLGSSSRSRYRGGSGSSSGGSSCDDDDCMYIGIGIGCGVAVLLIVVGIIVCCVKGVCKVPNCCKPSTTSSKVDLSEGDNYFMEKY